MVLPEAVELNLDALRRIVLTLAAMVGSGTATLPRHACNAVRRLLRPAESAARRLIIAAARDIVVTLPIRKAKPERPFQELTTKQKMLLLRRRRMALDRACYWRPRKRRPQGIAFPLLDPAYRPFRKKRRTIPDHKLPRVRSLFAPALVYRPAPPPAAPPFADDPVKVERLCRRIAVLAAALDDIPGQARRFATWRARVQRRKAAEEARAQQQPSTTAGRASWIRDWPLRLGRPYAGRLVRWDPDAPRGKNIREIDEILARAHGLALEALDSS
jgi:hypothetical protein